jgi:hypothetical protein
VDRASNHLTRPGPHSSYPTLLHTIALHIIVHNTCILFNTISVPVLYFYFSPQFTPIAQPRVTQHGPTPLIPFLFLSYRVVQCCVSDCSILFYSILFCPLHAKKERGRGRHRILHGSNISWSLITFILLPVILYISYHIIPTPCHPNGHSTVSFCVHSSFILFVFGCLYILP